MKIFKTMIALVCACGIANAQEQHTADVPHNADQEHLDALKHSQKLVFFNNEEKQASQDSVRALMDKFYVDQYKHFQDPEAPYFLMMSRDATLAMGIGGAVRMRGYYDFDGAVPLSGFIPYTIPVPANPEMRRRLDATPSGTALFFRIIGINKALGDFSAFIQGSFDGGTGREFKIKKSYVTIREWTIGYTVSTFCDLAANPPVIDAQGPNGQVNNTSVLLQWRHGFKKHWAMAASLEFPKSYITVDGVRTRQPADWLPDVAAWGQWQWAGGAGHVRLSGLLRFMPYYNVEARKHHTLPGYGLQMSAVAPVDYSWTLYAEGVGGRGIESYINDFMVTQLDLVPSADDATKLYAPWCYGLTAGVKYNIRHNLFCSVAGSQARYLPRTTQPTDYRYGLYGVANVIWNMSARLQVGGEFLIGMRKNAGGESASCKRVNMLFQFSF